ncbi:MAG: hypothetical protein ACPGL0_07640 [Limisphaerales bacterium]
MSNLLKQTIRGSLLRGFLVFGWIILFQGELLGQPQPRPETRSAIHPLPLASVDAKGSAWLEAGGLVQSHWMYQAQLAHPDGHTYFLAQPKSEAPTPPGKETGFNLYRTLDDPSGIETFATGFRQPFALVMDDWGNLFVMDALGPQAYGARWLQIFQGAHYGWHTIDEPVAGYFPADNLGTGSHRGPSERGQGSPPLLCGRILPRDSLQHHAPSPHARSQ